MECGGLTSPWIEAETAILDKINRIIQDSDQEQPFLPRMNTDGHGWGGEERQPNYE